MRLEKGFWIQKVDLGLGVLSGPDFSPHHAQIYHDFCQVQRFMVEIAQGNNFAACFVISSVCVR